jgi:hypothetical protein
MCDRLAYIPTIAKAHRPSRAIRITGINDDSPNSSSGDCKVFSSQLHWSGRDKVSSEKCGSGCSRRGFNERQISASAGLDTGS